MGFQNFPLQKLESTIFVMWNWLKQVTKEKEKKPDMFDHGGGVAWQNTCAPSEKKDPVLKVVMMGASMIGKSGPAFADLLAFVTRFVQDRFTDFHQATIGASFFTKTLEFSNCSAKVQMWDTSGQVC